MDEFLAGFARSAGLSASDADAQWAAFAWMLCDSEREAIELGGQLSGEHEGRRFLELHPDEVSG